MIPEQSLEKLYENLPDPEDITEASRICDKIKFETATQDEIDFFYEIASHIVEPDISDKSYFDFMDSNPDNWASFIENILGEHWGRIARTVVEFGY